MRLSFFLLGVCLIGAACAKEKEPGETSEVAAPSKSQETTPAVEPANQAKNSAQVERLPDDLVAVDDAQYAPLDGLALGSGEAQERQRQAVQQLRSPLEVKTHKTGIVLRLIPGGTFTMGSPVSESQRDSDETPHQVTLTKPFYCGKFEVTQGQWEQVMGSNPSHFKNAGIDGPVEGVSWEDCQVFLKKLCQIEGVEQGTYRLLTEAQWEYACRAGTATAFCYGNDLDSGMANLNGNYPYGKGRKGQFRQSTVAVGSFRSNGWGLYDMHGNVWEWCQDWFGVYPGGSATDPVGPRSGNDRVLRGASWGSIGRDCRSALRYGDTPANHKNSDLGFRLARTVLSQANDNTSPSDISDYKNFDDFFDKMAHTKFDASAANRDPPDINPTAKALRDRGMDLFHKENRLQEGIEKIEAALKIDPRMPDAYNALALYYALAQKDPQTAARYLEDGIKHCPKSSSVRVDLGNVYAQMNQPTKAIAQFTAAINLGFERKAPVLYNIGNAYAALDRMPDAISYFRKALEEDEKHLNARRNLVIALVQIGDRKAARQEAQRLLELDRNGEIGDWARQALRQIDST